MMSLESIRAMSAEAAARAAEERQEPFVFWDEAEVDAADRFPLPFIGDYVPAGWTKREDYFVDATGWGYEWEPALTRDQFKAKVKEAIRRQPGSGWAVTQVGQFQVYVHRFERAQSQEAA